MKYKSNFLKIYDQITWKWTIHILIRYFLYVEYILEVFVSPSTVKRFRALIYIDIPNRTRLLLLG